MPSTPSCSQKEKQRRYTQTQSHRHRHIGRTIKEKDRQRPTGTHQTMTADGVASFTVGSTYLNASTENPVHVSAKALDRVT